MGPLKLSFGSHLGYYVSLPTQKPCLVPNFGLSQVFSYLQVIKVTYNWAEEKKYNIDFKYGPTWVWTLIPLALLFGPGLKNMVGASTNIC